MDYQNVEENFEEIQIKHTSKNDKVLGSGKIFYDNLLEYNKTIFEWSDKIIFRDLKGLKSLSKVYIDLDLYITPSSLQMDNVEKNNKVSMEETFINMHNNVVILGQPGAGKTTSMKRVFKHFIEKKYELKFNFPLLINLRELKEYDYSIFRFLADKFNIVFENHKEEISFKNSEFEKPTRNIIIEELNIVKHFNVFSRFFIDLFNKNKVLIILDGFDEIPRSVQYLFIREINTLSKNLSTSRFILTSRSSDFTLMLDNSEVFEICPLDPNQLEAFASKWLTDEKTSKEFIKQIKLSPYYDTMIRPLTLSHLCAIYERIGKIPEKPKTVHRKVVALLIEEWDEQRQVRRESKYSNFEQDRKFEFLANFAFLLTTKYEKANFTNTQLKSIYLGIYQNFGLPEDDLDNVINEIETHTGIIICNAQDQYEFAHKSTQEYLTAEYLVKLPNIPLNLNLLIKIPNEMALAISLSSSQSLYFTSLLFDRFFPICQKLFKSPDTIRSLATRTTSYSTKSNITNNDFKNFLFTLTSRLVIEKPDIPKTALTTISFLFINSFLIYDIKLISNISILLERYCSLDDIKYYYNIEEVKYLNKYYFSKKEVTVTTSYELPDYLAIDSSQLKLLKK